MVLLRPASSPKKELLLPVELELPASAPKKELRSPEVIEAPAPVSKKLLLEPSVKNETPTPPGLSVVLSAR